VDLLNCYYAHAEDSLLFQRRSYWLLDSVDSQVVLVHYLEVLKGTGSARILGGTGRSSPNHISSFLNVHPENSPRSSDNDHDRLASMEVKHKPPSNQSTGSISTSYPPLEAQQREHERDR
jgi:hypothetical protein